MDFKNVKNLYELKMKSNEKNLEYYNINSSEITSKDLGVKKLFFDIKELLPGQLSCPYHYHHDNEASYNDYVAMGKSGVFTYC